GGTASSVEAPAVGAMHGINSPRTIAAEKALARIVSLTGWEVENLLGEVVEVGSPLRRIVPEAIYVPHMRHFIFFQIRMHSLADVDESILVAAGKPEQLQFFDEGRIGQKFSRRLCVGGG